MEHVNYLMKHSPERRSLRDSRWPLALKNAGPVGTLVLIRKPAPLTIRHHTTPHPRPGGTHSCLLLFIFGRAGACCCAGFALAAAGGGSSHHSARASRCASSRVAGHGFRSCSTGLPLPFATWDLPGSGLEPTSPAVAGGFFTTEPPRKPRTQL